MGSYDNKKYNVYECPLCHMIKSEEIITDAVRGDFNNDGKVTVEDAAYLLKNVMLGSSVYPIYQSADVNGDGMTNVVDVDHLLKFIMLGAGAAPLAG